MMHLCHYHRNFGREEEALIGWRYMGLTKDQVSRPCEINDSFDWQVAIMTSSGRQVDSSGNQTRGNGSGTQGKHDRAKTGQIDNCKKENTWTIYILGTN